MKNQKKNKTKNTFMILAVVAIVLVLVIVAWKRTTERMTERSFTCFGEDGTSHGTYHGMPERDWQWFCDLRPECNKRCTPRRT